MKAIRIAEYGGSETLVLGDVDAPEPGAAAVDDNKPVG